MSLRKLLLLMGLLLLAAPVLAETGENATDKDASGGQQMTGHMGRSGHGMWGERDPKAMVEGRLAYVKTALGITDDQSTAWNSYADTARTNQEGMHKAFETMRDKMHSGSAIDRMQSRISMLQARLDALKALQPSTETLYKGLSPEQQKKADHLLSGGFGRI
jgi:LTXXQ motif family protein